MRSTSSYGATGTRSPPLCSVSRPGAGASVVMPIAASSSPMIVHVDDRRDVRQLVGAVGEDRRRHQLEHGVLGAGDVDRAVQLADAAHDDLPPGPGSVVHAGRPEARSRPPSMLPRCWQAVTAATAPTPPPTGRTGTARSSASGPTTRRSPPVLRAPARRPRARAGGPTTARSSRPTARSPATAARSTRLPATAGSGARRRRTAGRCRGSPGSSPSRCAGRSPAGARRRRTPPTHHAAPTPWWAPPDRLDPRALTVLGLLAAASMSSAFVNTLFTQTVNFAADDFGVSDTRHRRRRVDRAGRDHPRPAGRRARRPHRPPPGRHGDGHRRARSSRPPARSPRRSRSSSPPRRSAGRSAWPSTSSSPSSPPRRCRATAGPTPVSILAMASGLGAGRRRDGPAAGRHLGELVAARLPRRPSSGSSSPSTSPAGCPRRGASSGRTSSRRGSTAAGSPCWRPSPC